MLTLPPDFKLSQSVGFLRGFTPQRVEATTGPIQLCFATPLSPSWNPTSFTITQPEDKLRIEWSGQVDRDLVAAHVARILSIDVDGSDFAAVADADHVVRDLVDVDRGFRPPLFWSPYEAAIWSVLSQRVQMAQATKLKRAIATAIGTVHGGLAATPAPSELGDLTDFPGLPAIKVERLRAVARAAIAGLLDPERLRGQRPEAAIAELQKIDGIGPFSAELILIRGAGAPDVFPSREKRLHAAMRLRYDKAHASVNELETIAEKWAPYRSWVSFNLRAAAERDEVQPQARQTPPKALRI